MLLLRCRIFGVTKREGHYPAIGDAILTRARAIISKVTRVIIRATVDRFSKTGRKMQNASCFEGQENVENYCQKLRYTAYPLETHWYGVITERSDNLETRRKHNDRTHERVTRVRRM